MIPPKPARCEKGHLLAQSTSPLYCSRCKVEDDLAMEREEAQPRLDAEWNAALEAAIKAVDVAFAADEDVSAQEVIRALKREAKP